jgi:dTDP-4-dehydrorhamnose 3,5-epimerase
MLTLADFAADTPWQPSETPLAQVTVDGQIDGVVMNRLQTKADGRGELTVLMSDLYSADGVTPHVYHVLAAPKSVRAWVYHQRQSDRLAYFNGTFRVVLYDLRPDSPTYGALNVLNLGAENPVLLTIPPFVVHGVQNMSDQPGYFINMPTRAYDPVNPDKLRIANGHPGIPYVFG